MATQHNAPGSTGGAAKPMNPHIMRGLIAAAVALVVFTIGFFIGRNGLGEAREELAKAKTDAAAQVADAQKEVTAGKTREEAAAARIALFNARNFLYRSALDLERRDFGAAQKNLALSNLAMEQGNLSAGGFTAAQTDPLKTAVQSVKIVVSTDVSQQRNQILQIVERIDKLLPVSGVSGVAQTVP